MKVWSRGISQRLMLGMCWHIFPAPAYTSEMGRRRRARLLLILQIIKLLQMSYLHFVMFQVAFNGGWDLDGFAYSSPNNCSRVSRKTLLPPSLCSGQKKGS